MGEWGTGSGDIPIMLPLVIALIVIMGIVIVLTISLLQIDDLREDMRDWLFLIVSVAIAGLLFLGAILYNMFLSRNDRKMLKEMHSDIKEMRSDIKEMRSDIKELISVVREMNAKLDSFLQSMKDSSGKK